MLFSFGMTFAYWASSVSGNQQSGESMVSLGSWYDGIPIYNADEFIEAVMLNNNTNTYVLARNIDFQNATLPTWTANEDIVFAGILDGNGKTISNISKSDLRGIFGVLDGATIKNLTLDNINLNYTPTGAITSGILSGRIQGTGNLIENIRIKNSSGINTGYPVGAIAGVIQPASGVTTAVEATIQNIKITNTTITGGYNEVNFGTGGIAGTVTTANVIMNDLYVEANISSSAQTNIGGIVGATRTAGNVTINRAVVFSNLSMTNASTVTTHGVGAMIGRNSGTATINHTIFSGFMRSRVVNPSNNNWTTQVGILRGTITGTAVTFTNSRSAQITLYRNTTNQSVAVANTTNYNKMTGQKATYVASPINSATYVNSRSSLTNAWWTQAYSTITSQPTLWEYNTTTFLYQLKD